ncbi:MAG: hypothetical protein QM658_05245 [Gordonia sp. (in: high G+C Gram-positive bacteria)]
MGLLLLLPLVLGLATASGLARLSGTRSALSGDHLVIAEVFRRLIGWRIGGFVAGLALAVAIPVVALGVFHLDAPEALVFWAPAALALVYLLSLLIGEHVAYRPADAQRSATLTPRAPGRYVTVRDLAVPLAVTVWFAAVAVWTWAITNESGNVLITCASPYPNDYNASSHSSLDRSTAWACLAAVAVAAVLTRLVAHQASFRPRPDTEVFALAEDDALRRSSIRAALGIYTSFVAIVGAGFTLSLADVLTSDFEPCGAPSWWYPVGVALWWSLLVWLAAYVWGIVQVVSRPVPVRTSAMIG